MKNIIAIVFFLICFQAIGQQSEVHPCGTSEAVRESLEQNPQLQENLYYLEQFTREYTANSDNKLLDSTITIPVVFHVFHTYGAERISEAQIRDCIRILNEDYQNLNADSAQVSSLFQPLIGRPQIRFRLARLDPNGRCTEGINYIESGLHTAGGENLKSVISWDTRKYLNIWVCSVVASGAAAYSYYPGTAPGQNNEGVVSRSDYVGGTGTSQAGYRARTMTHEVGHYLNLPHTWGSSNTPGASTNCNIDDGVQDTPNCVGVSNASCPLTQNNCGPIANVENHMEYSNCRRMFTKGQVLRMHAAINSTTAFRSSLWKTSNLLATGTTTDAPPVMDCPPKPDFKSNFTRLCAGQPITFTQLTYNVANPDSVKYFWSFPGGTPETSTAENPVVSYSTAGTYNVKLVVSNQYGKDSLIRNSYIGILPSNATYSEADVEGFETATFPIFTGNPDKTWDIKGMTIPTWKRTSTASFSGSACLSVANTASTSGNVHTIISPVFEVTGSLNNVKLNFKHAFARRTATNNDKLVVSYSTNCGKTWFQAFNRSGANLATVTNTVSGTFVPVFANWKKDSANISFLSGSSTFRLKFEFTAGGGNYLYIDDIQLVTVTSVDNVQDDQLGLNLYPNPSQNELPVVEIRNARASKAKIEIVDIMGRECIWSRELMLNAGQTENFAAQIWYLLGKDSGCGQGDGPANESFAIK
jgi:PKD repeat protein